MSGVRDPAPREYDTIMQALTSMRDMLTKVHEVLNRPAAAEWESMHDACNNRRKGRAAILAEVEAGRVRFMTVPGRGGVQTYMLKVVDLDRFFPVRPLNARKRGPKPKEQPAGDPPPAADDAVPPA